jgi:small subunit ribosomal protein S4
MGDPKKTKKKYEVPKKRWDKNRIESEKKIKQLYGLKNKRELRVAETILRKKRKNARDLLALPLEERIRREKELMQSLTRLGLLKSNAVLDDVLSLSIEEILERRLQTIVWRKNYATTISQARQFIVHGLIAIDGKKVSSPSYLVKAGEESKIGYFGKKPLVMESQKTESKDDLKKKFEEAGKVEESEGQEIEKENAPAEETKEEKQKASDENQAEKTETEKKDSEKKQEVKKNE